jgi:hypothetical protein
VARRHLGQVEADLGEDVHVVGVGQLQEVPERGRVDVLVAQAFAQLAAGIFVDPEFQQLIEAVGGGAEDDLAGLLGVLVERDAATVGEADVEPAVRYLDTDALGDGLGLGVGLALAWASAGMLPAPCWRLAGWPSNSASSSRLAAE